MFNFYLFTPVSIIAHVLQNVQQDGCAREVVSGATLANTGVVVVPHWPKRMWWWCHIGQHGCGGGATLANTGVVASGNKLVDAGSCATCASEGPAVAGTTHALKAPSMMTSAFCSRLFQLSLIHI